MSNDPSASIEEGCFDCTIANGGVCTCGAVDADPDWGALHAARCAKMFDYLNSFHVGISAFTMDGHQGEPTRKLFVVDGCTPDCAMPLPWEAVERAIDRYPDGPPRDDE